MDVVLECKDERAEGTCDTEATRYLWIRFSFSKASTILLRVQLAGLALARLNYSHEACANDGHSHG